MLGASWQVPQVPRITGLPVASFYPATPVMLIGSESNTRSPRAIAMRRWNRHAGFVRLFGGFNGELRVAVIQRHALPLPTRAQPQPVACPVDQQVAHRARRVGEELRRLLETEFRAVTDPQVQFVDQLGGVQRAAAVAGGETPRRHRLQAVVDLGEQRVGRAAGPGLVRVGGHGTSP